MGEVAMSLSPIVTFNFCTIFSYIYEQAFRIFFSARLDVEKAPPFPSNV